MGQASSAIKTVQTAREIVEEMVAGAAVTMYSRLGLEADHFPRMLQLCNPPDTHRTIHTRARAYAGIPACVRSLPVVIWLWCIAR